MAGKRRFTVEILGDEKGLTRSTRKGADALGDLDDAAKAMGKGIESAADKAGKSLGDLSDEQIDAAESAAKLREAELNVEKAMRDVQKLAGKLSATDEQRERAAIRLTKAQANLARATRKGADEGAESVERGSRRTVRAFGLISAGAHGLTTKVGAGLKGLAGAGVAAGIGLGLGLKEGIDHALDVGAARAKLAAQLDLTKQDAARIGALAGKIYSGNYGESLADVNDAIRTVIQNGAVLRKTQSADLQVVTQGVLNLANTYEQDLGGVTRAIGQMIRTGLVKDGAQALDVLSAGFAAGNDKAEDLLDTFNEYPTQFRKLGITGAQAMGLISQGLKAGARDSDIVADALKEFSIRAVDGSTLTAQGFKMLGLSVKDVAREIGEGGLDANDALDLVLDRLRKIPDPVKRSQVAVALFGTQAEDLGQALFALDPSAATLNNVAGAAERLDSSLSDNPSAQLEKIKRTLETKITGGFLQAFEYIEKHRFEVADGLLAIAEVASNLIAPLGALTSAAMYLGAGLLYVAAAGAMAKLNFKLGRELFDAAKGLQDGAGKAYELGQALQDKANPALADLRAKLDAAKRAADGAAPAQTNAAHAALGLSGSAIRGARSVNSVTDALHRVPRNTTFRVRGDTSQAIGAIGDIVRRLSVLQNGKTVHVVQIIGDNRVTFGGGAGRPGGNTAMADGGLFRGEGGPRDDQNVVLLSDEEYVMPAAQTKKFLPVLEAMRNGKVRAMAGGGQVAKLAQAALSAFRKGNFFEDFSFRGMGRGFDNDRLADLFYGSHPGADFGTAATDKAIDAFLSGLARPITPGRVVKRSPAARPAAAGKPTVVLEINSSGSKVDDLLVEIIRRAVRVKGGGNVQVALGRG